MKDINIYLILIIFFIISIFFLPKWVILAFLGIILIQTGYFLYNE